MSKTAKSDPIVPVILSGGAGTRLWPISRRDRPKQFLPLVSDAPLIVDTARRVSDAASFAPPMFVANDEHRFMIAQAMRDADLPHGTIVLEPEGRNTAASICAAALIAARDGANPMLLVLPSDHMIADAGAFIGAIAAGAGAARHGYLTVFGIHPSRAETGYGYIKSGAALGDAPGTVQVERFVEKPDAATAQSYLDQGGWSWNSGMFLFRAETVLAAFKALAPDILTAAAAAVDAAATDLDFLRLDAAAWKGAPAQPFDKAVMEKTDRAAVVAADIGWSDIGTWSTLAGAGTADADGNVIQGAAIMHDSRGSFAYSQGPLVALLGVEDLAVVATNDVTLVLPKRRAEDMRALVERLQAAKRPELDGSPVTYRPWGHFEDIDAGPGFRVKRLVVDPGQRLSRQLHNHRAEHWVVVSGTAHVLRGDDDLVIDANQSVYIPVKTQHRLENKGTAPLQVIEVQTGDYLEEDDIVRFEDVYGRA